jgi:cell division protein FtsB
MQRSAVKAQIKNVDDMTASQMAMQAEIKDLKKNLNKMMKLVESLTPKDKV